MKIRSGKTVRYLTLLSLTLALVFSFAAVGTGETGAQLAEQFLKKAPISSFDATMTLGAAEKAQEEFVAVISKEYGEPVGYKAGLTNPNVQKAFGVNSPVRGTLLRKMLLPSGSVVAANFAAIPASEGDLIVRVGDEAINQATTKAEALKGLDAVIPFIELPDMLFDKSFKPTGPAIVANNVGARCGIMGEPIPLAPTPEWQQWLKTFILQVYDEKGVLITEGKGAALMGDPLDVVLWIKGSLAAEGKKLKKGDLLSLGSLTRPMPVKPGTGIRAKYIGLGTKGPVEISVSFK